MKTRLTGSEMGYKARVLKNTGDTPPQPIVGGWGGRADDRHLRNFALQWQVGSLVFPEGKL